MKLPRYLRPRVIGTATLASMSLSMSLLIYVSSRHAIQISTKTPWTVANISTDDGADTVDVHVSAVDVHVNEDDRCVRNFLDGYEKFCRQANIPERRKTYSKGVRQFSGTADKELCPCVPEGLRGYTNVTKGTQFNLAEVEHSLQTLQKIFDSNLVGGGRWYPVTCIARQCIAVIVPFRKREEDLRRLLYSLHPVLQRQMLDYTIFVVEQLKPSVFNRGALMNAGFVEAKKTGNFDCYVFHDVDMFPADDHNFYTCSPTPRHMGRHRDHRVYKYSTYFGGVVAISPAHFELVNGFSNDFYGWGGEDDDFFRRIRAKKLKLSQPYPRCVSRYFTSNHLIDADNRLSKNGRRGTFTSKEDNGLKTLGYVIFNYSKMLTYTRISVILPQPKITP